MKNTTKAVRVLTTLSFCLFVLELTTTKAMPINEESIKLDEMSSGQHRNNDKDDDLFGGESDKGSGESVTLDKPENPDQSTLLNDKQVDKLIQAEDLGLNGHSDSETSGKSPNNVPNFKDSSKEEPDAIFSPNDNSKNEELSDENNMENEANVQEKEGATNKIAVGEPEVADSTAPASNQSKILPQQHSAEQPVVTVSIAPQESQSFGAEATQPEVTMNTPPDQSQSFAQTMTSAQQDAQPAVTAYSAAAAPTADDSASATQQTFNDAALQQADYQSTATSAYNGQQPAETTNSAAAVQATGDSDAATQQTFNDAALQQADYQTATSAYSNQQPAEATNSADAAQQWDTTASAVPQVAQQYNDAAASSQQAAQTSNTNSYTNEGKSHTIQLDGERYRTLICQNGKDTISCPPNQQISIRDANYGSMGASACLGRQAYGPSQFCKTPGAYEIVKTNCDDMENCELMANDDLFGEECETDRKYLDLEYDCVPSKSPAAPYQGGFPPQAMYPAQQSQYMYPGAQPAAPAYAPSPYQGYPPQQGYGQQQQQQEQELAQSPPAPKLPELMSTLVAMSQKSQTNTQQQCSTQCNTCNQCSAMPVCNPCPVCQSSACSSVSSAPYIPKGLRPLWELWNEKTADMNRMEMSALIISPVPKLPPTKKSSSLTEKSEGSGDENSDKRSHVKSSKKKASTSSKKSKDVSKHSTIKTKKALKKSSKTKHS